MKSVASMLMAAVLFSGNALAESDSSSTGDFEGWEPYLKFRYRAEHVDQTGFDDHALASTLRTLLGVKSASYNDFRLVLEAENVSVIGNDTYNSTVNGVTDRPVVADPDGTEINKLYISYEGLENNLLRIGRQDHNLDNQRFIGTVGWRQNDQAYDSVLLSNTAIADTTVTYIFVDDVQRIFGKEHPLGDLEMSSHLVNLSYDGLAIGKLTAYGYFLDMQDTAVVGLSSRTYGLRFNGKHKQNDNLNLLYTAEYAHQSDYEDNPTHFSTRYYNLEGGVEVSGVTAKVGMESLGSDNNQTSAFQTPLATLHKFNGWADKFLATPGAGLEDTYLSLSSLFDIRDRFFNNFSNCFGIIELRFLWQVTDFDLRHRHGFTNIVIIKTGHNPE